MEPHVIVLKDKSTEVISDFNEISLIEKYMGMDASNYYGKRLEDVADNNSKSIDLAVDCATDELKGHIYGITNTVLESIEALKEQIEDIKPKKLGKQIYETLIELEESIKFQSDNF